MVAVVVGVAVAVGVVVAVVVGVVVAVVVGVAVAVGVVVAVVVGVAVAVAVGVVVAVVVGVAVVVAVVVGERMKLLETILLPVKLTNGNSGRTKHFGKSAQVRKQFERDLALLGYRRTEPFPPCGIYVRRILGKGERLWDLSSGLRGNWKELEDALVALGWFPDDSPKHIKAIQFQQDGDRRHEGPAVELRIYKK